jgi:predicted transcriptional regulator
MTKSMQLAVRLDDELTDRLDWLAEHLGISSHGKIVRLAIEELVNAERQRAGED